MFLLPSNAVLAGGVAAASNRPVDGRLSPPLPLPATQWRIPHSAQTVRTERATAVSSPFSFPDDASSSPSSPSSTSSVPSTPSSPVPLHSHAFPSSVPPSLPFLSCSSPFASLSVLASQSVSDLRISDCSHSQANPSQRKKGGCKAVRLTVRVGSSEYAVAAKCDVRKSFSNRSFSQYYDRGQYAVVPVDAQGDVVLVVEEAKKGRDGKHFVAMERSCTPPFAGDDANPRHPLLAFAADAVYRLTVCSRLGDQAADEDVSVEVKCLFEQGYATVVKKQPSASLAVGPPALVVMKAKRRPSPSAEVSDKRQRLGQTVIIDALAPSPSPSSASESESTSSGESPHPSLSDSPSPSTPESALSSLSSSPLPSYLSIHLLEPSLDLFFLDDPSLPCLSLDGRAASQAVCGLSAASAVSSSMFLSSPFRSPMAAARGAVGLGSGLDGGSPCFGWLDGVTVEMPEFVLR